MIYTFLISLAVQVQLFAQQILVGFCLGHNLPPNLLFLRQGNNCCYSGTSFLIQEPVLLRLKYNKVV